MWTIVIFIEENSVEVVPKTWLYNDKKFCFWPKDKEKVVQKISSCESPANPLDTEKWDLYRIRFPGGEMKLYDDFLRARKACQSAENYSSLSDSTDTERKRKKKRIVFETDESEDETLSQHKPSIPFPKYTPSRLNNNLNSNPQGEDELPTKTLSLSATSHHRCPSSRVSSPFCKSISPFNATLNDIQESCSSNPGITKTKDDKTVMDTTTTNGLLHSVFRELAKINVKIDLVQQDISKLLQGEKKTDTSTEDCFFFKDLIPIKTDPTDLEEKLTDKENFKKFVNFVTLIGGHHTGDAVSRSFTRIVSNNAASMYSWKGKKGKKCFENLKLCNAVIEGIMLNPKVVATRKDVEIEIMSWLRHAPERLKREK